MRCLYHAAVNILNAPGKSGELVDIALKAMAAEPRDRYQSVIEFREAVRNYRSHVESYNVMESARKDLVKAEDNKSYKDFQQALFGFRESVKLWDGNTQAAALELSAALSYGQCAFEKADYDLALDLLNPEEETHKELIGKAQAARDERDRRAGRIKFLNRLAVAMGVIIIAVVSTAAYTINEDRKEISKQKDEINVAHADLKEANGNLTEVRQKQAQAQADLVKKEEALVESEKRLSQSLAITKAKEAEMKNITNQLAGLVTDKEKVDGQLQDANALLERAKKDKREKDQQIAKNVGTIEVQRSQLKKMADAVEQKVAELKVKEEDLKKKTVELEAKTAELVAKNTQLTNKQAELNAVSEQMKVAQAELVAKQAEVAAAEAQAAAAKAHIAELDEMMEKHEAGRRFKDGRSRGRRMLRD